jgi:hypothetical protein
MSMKGKYIFRVLVLYIIVVSCADDESALRPAFIEPVSPQSDNIYLSEGPYFVAVRVTNENRDPLPHIEVKFKISQGEGELSTTNGRTDANGVAYTYLLGHPNTVSISLEAVASQLSSKAIFRYGISRSYTSNIRITEGNNQEVLAGTIANNLLTVKVMDDLGNVATSVPVKFVVLEGNGQVSSEVSSTNQSGEATTEFRASNTTTTNTVAAIVGPDSVSFQLESLYSSSLSVISSRNNVAVKWSKNKATTFKKYSLQRAGSDGIYKPLKEFSTISDTTYIDHSTDLTVNETYMYKLTVHTNSTFVESFNSILFGEFINLEGFAFDFEVDETRNQIYVSLPELNQIHIYNLSTYELLEKVTVGSKPHGINLSRDNATLYIALFGSGKVAFLNLTTKQVIQIDVSEELGNLKAFDVVEGAPGRVFVTGSPESYGIAFISLIKTDENNSVERFMSQIVRDQPAMAVDYGKFIYVINGRQLFKLDPYGVYLDTAQEPDYYLPSYRKFILLDPSGSKLYLDFESLHTNPITAANTFGFNVPALSPDGSVVHYHAGSVISSYSTSTQQKLKETRFYTNYLRKLQLTSDNNTFIALGVNYALVGDVLYFIQNK